MSLVLLADVKTHLNITGTTYDPELQTMIDAAESAIAQMLNCGSTLATQAITQRAAGRTRTLVLTRGPVVSVTSVTGSLSGALTLSDLDIDLEHGLIYYPPLQALAFLDPYYTVVYQAGYTSLTPDLVLAVKELVRHFWASQRGGASRPGQGGGGGDAASFAAQVGAFPTRVLELLNNYQVSGFA